MFDTCLGHARIGQGIFKSFLCTAWSAWCCPLFAASHIIPTKRREGRPEVAPPPFVYLTSAANYVIPATNEYEGTVNVLKATTQFVVNDFKDEQSYITIGARWDFHDSAALKFEYTDFTDDLNGMNDTGLFRTALVTVF